MEALALPPSMMTVPPSLARGAAAGGKGPYATLYRAHKISGETGARTVPAINRAKPHKASSTLGVPSRELGPEQPRQLMFMSSTLGRVNDGNVDSLTNAIKRMFRFGAKVASTSDSGAKI